jgi:hypothetical protein
MSDYYSVPKGEVISLAWGDGDEGVVFRGVTWSGHHANLIACQESDLRISELDSRLVGERAIRSQNRSQLAESNRKVYYGVMAHPEFGDDRPLLAQMGYTRRSDQDSGLSPPAV